MARVDVVVVSFNSASHLRRSVERLSRLDWVRVIVVDNSSTDRTLETVEDLPIRRVPLGYNGGFGHGCNVGWRLGRSPFVLFLNPDAQIDADSLSRLASLLESNARVGIGAPKTLNTDGSLQFVQHRFPRLRSTYGRVFFLHRLFPRSLWASEEVTDPAAYSRPGSPEWVAGACLLIRRTLLERLEGFDERFFHYCEDMDLCYRARLKGFDIRYEPSALAVHEGGASAPAATLLPTHVASRIRYARKHHGRIYTAFERFGIVLAALARVLFSREGRKARSGHARSVAVAFRRATGSGR